MKDFTKKCFFLFSTPMPIPSISPEGKDEHRKGLLHMKMAEGAKLQMCYLLQHLNDIQLRHRVEAIIAFAHDFVGDLQTDQLR